MRSVTAAALVAIAFGLQPAQHAPAIIGVVLLPDGTPASRGTIAIESPMGYGGNARIDGRGEFRYEPVAGGVYDVRVNVPGFVARPMRVEFPKRSDVRLPPIHLLPEPYARARILAPSGELLSLPRVLAAPLFPSLRDSVASRANVQADPDGQFTKIGPLPYGATVLTIDQLPYARTRLPPIQATGEVPLIDLGTITLQPGATIDATIVDENGSPVRGHRVYLAPTATQASSTDPPAFTGPDGHARFDRLAAGTYVVRTSALRTCPPAVVPIVERRVKTDDRGTASVAINVGGFAANVRVRWGGLPLGSAPVAVRECSGTADADGTATIRDVPAGHASVSIAVLDSVWTRPVEMHPRESTFSFDVPPGVVTVRVVHAGRGAPIADATVIASSAGARIETRTGGDGSAMIQGVADGDFGVEVRARGYRRAERTFNLPPDTVQEIELTPDPDLSLTCVVMSERGVMLSDAIVALEPQDPVEPVRVAVTSDRQMVTTSELPQGTVRITASHDGYVSATKTVTLPLSNNAPLVFTLAAVNATAEKSRSCTAPSGSDRRCQ